MCTAARISSTVNLQKILTLHTSFKHKSSSSFGHLLLILTSIMKEIIKTLSRYVRNSFPTKFAKSLYAPGAKRFSNIVINLFSKEDSWF